MDDEDNDNSKIALALLQMATHSVARARPIHLTSTLLQTYPLRLRYMFCRARVCVCMWMCSVFSGWSFSHRPAITTINFAIMHNEWVKLIYKRSLLHASTTAFRVSACVCRSVGPTSSLPLISPGPGLGWLALLHHRRRVFQLNLQTYISIGQ